MSDLIPSYSRETRLKCRHGFYLKVTDCRVEGTRDESDLHTSLTMESVRTAEVMLKGNASRKYIGMNSSGEIYITNDPTSPECVFKEIFGNRYNSYQSTVNPAWYLALTKQGEAKSGPKTKPGQRAVSFIAD